MHIKDFGVQENKFFCQINDFLLLHGRPQYAASIITSTLIFAGDMYILKAKQQEPILSSVIPCPLCNHFAPQNMVRATDSICLLQEYYISVFVNTSA